ncbi:MAG: flagellar biosynthesis anti-sigma factor FlgM [Acidobacteria bacterium]|nr:flagellar biosynthesis anti-sigma factor FlgM [Acidobacteriota bacterium]
MEIRNNAEALKAFLGVSSSESLKGAAVRRSESEKNSSPLAGDAATLSGVGAAMQSAAEEDGVRLDKVAAVQQALAAGTYNVPSAKVAEKLVETMLTAGVDGKR